MEKRNTGFINQRVNNLFKVMIQAQDMGCFFSGQEDRLTR